MIITNLLCNKDIDTDKIINMQYYILKIMAIKHYQNNTDREKDATTVLNVLKELYPEYFI